MLRGLSPDSPPGTAPRPDYDPGRWSLARREQVKAAELAAAGHPVSAATVKRHRQRYQARGVVGLVDHRVDRRRAGFVLWRTEQILAGSDPPVVVPSRRTLYRLFGRLAHGRHVTGSARARRSLAARPDGPVLLTPSVA
ncbi:hypothetical protein [Parafrankia soli]|uniref:hypothetical protein n=1 Tax=Parafrankia soli TaxID=2599596 RepID=UPI000A6651E3|nr:hypothetical protein [Parafrankia soli]